MKKNIGMMMLCIVLASAISGCLGRSYEPPPAEVTQEEDGEINASGADIVRLEIEPVTETAHSPGTRKGPGAMREQAEYASAIDPEGMTLETRFPSPRGYERVPAEEGSFQAFMRQQALKTDGSPVLLYNGEEKHSQSVHAAVFTMPGFESDLQQCADSVMRMYAEYFWSIGAYDQIAFHLTNGFLMDYPAWRDGNRLSVDGNQVSWVKKSSYDDSYETFLLYLKYMMMYAGTLSLDAECGPADISQIQAGDLFIKGGSPGHCVMVTDVAVREDGDICYLLSQSYMPGQDFHVLKNPLHESDPWYYVSELTYPLITPEYVFQEGSFQRWPAFFNQVPSSLD